MSQELFTTASSQHGLLTRGQRYQTGLTHHRVARWVTRQGRDGLVALRFWYALGFIFEPLVC